MPRLLLKARPVRAQLLDRTREPLPDGIELYLDAVDLADSSAMSSALAEVRRLELPDDFDILIEGPVRSLDGQFFDVTRQATADRQVVERLAYLAGELGAKAVNVHLIAPRASTEMLTLEGHRIGLERGVDLLSYFAETMLGAGTQPTIENMPPVLRMRESGFYYSAIGMASSDLAWMCSKIPGLRSTLDVSHAGLYLNCQRYAAGQEPPQGEDRAAPELYDLARQLSNDVDLHAYAVPLEPSLLSCHVSNARGLLGEGEPYAEGDLDLDRELGLLSETVTYFVTETLEASQDSAVEMRRALAGMRAALVGTASR